MIVSSSVYINREIEKTAIDQVLVPVTQNELLITDMLVTSLSVLMWPHFPHLMHLTLRT